MANKKTFKDFIHEDLDVFFNLDEMAEEHELDGETLPIVVTEINLNNNRPGIPREQLYVSQEVYAAVKTVYVRSTEFYLPEVGVELTLDGRNYFVEDASDQQGVIKIVLSANES
ncbi:MAG: hypothetical protein ABS920_07260 [Sporosarcina sp.]